MIDSNPKFSQVSKDRLFFDRFNYCISFHLLEANCLRDLNHQSIDDMLHRRQTWRQIAQQRWINGKQSPRANILSKRFNDITDQTYTDLHAVADILLNCKSEYKLVVSVNQGYVYTDDLSLISTLDQMPQLHYKNYTQAKINRPRNTVLLKKSPHKFRSYFKMTKLTAEQKQHLVAFLQTHQNHVRLSPALTEWMAIPFNRIQDYFFVDYDSELWLTMLALVHPGLIRKTQHIIQTK